MEFNDNTFIEIAGLLGYEVERETIETVNYDKEELYCNSVFQKVSNKITTYIGLVVEKENFVFSIYLDQENITLEGVIEAMTIDDDGNVVSIEENRLKEVIECLRTKDI